MTINTECWKKLVIADLIRISVGVLFVGILIMLAAIVCVMSISFYSDMTQAFEQMVRDDLFTAVNVFIVTESVVLISFLLLIMIREKTPWLMAKSCIYNSIIIIFIELAFVYAIYNGFSKTFADAWPDVFPIFMVFVGMSIISMPPALAYARCKE
jgi:hypothetical protein